VSDLVDNIKDIHPRNKQDVGKRLAQMALSETYGVTGLAYKFPSYQSVSAENNALRVHLKDAESGLMVKAGEKPMAFEIAGADKVFVPAEARIEGSTLVVSAKTVAKPVAVRYMFTNDGVGNVFSKEGLPVAPFRSDTW
ncbi:MAG: sialate O-acetylesterase, partial [Haliscomenobacter sp.]|nr:sialate O-acetylesterase [Haliscomenobacter sp.]